MQENASKYLTTAMPSTTSTPNTIIYCRCRFQNKSNEGPKGRQGTIHNRKQQEARRGVGAEVDHQLAESNTIPTHIGLGSHYIKNWTLVHLDDGLRDSTNLVDHTGPQPRLYPGSQMKHGLKQILGIITSFTNEERE